MKRRYIPPEASVSDPLQEADGAIWRRFVDVKKDYPYDPGIFNEEDARVRRVKEIIHTELSPVDRIIILLYIDCGSLRKLGRRFGVSYNTIAKDVRRIKLQILERL